MAWMLYGKGKMEAQATGNYRGLQQFKKILAHNKYLVIIPLKHVSDAAI